MTLTSSWGMGDYAPVWPRWRMLRCITRRRRFRYEQPKPSLSSPDRHEDRPLRPRSGPGSRLPGGGERRHRQRRQGLIGRLRRCRHGHHERPPHPQGAALPAQRRAPLARTQQAPPQPQPDRRRHQARPRHDHASLLRPPLERPPRPHGPHRREQLPAQRRLLDRRREPLLLRRRRDAPPALLRLDAQPGAPPEHPARRLARLRPRRGQHLAQRQQQGLTIVALFGLRGPAAKIHAPANSRVPGRPSAGERGTHCFRGESRPLPSSATLLREPVS